jgi:hypothetical protein
MAGGDCRAPIMRSIGKNAMGSVGGMPVIAQFNLFQGLSNSGGRDRPIAVAYERLYRILCKRSKIPITQETASCPGNSQTCIVPMNCSMSF